MTNEFDKLLREVNKLNSIEGERCLVCHFPDKTDNLIKLKCKHYYHEKCIKHLIKNNKIRCPYCDRVCRIKPDKVKKEKDTNKQIENVLTKNICNAVIKTGPRKGQICNRTNCRYHNKAIVV